MAIIKIQSGNKEIENKYTTEMINTKPRSLVFERTDTTDKPPIWLIKKKREGTNNQNPEERQETTIDPAGIKIAGGCWKQYYAIIFLPSRWNGQVFRKICHQKWHKNRK